MSNIGPGQVSNNRRHAAWTSDELNKIGNAEELQIASLRRDGTLRNRVTIWVVRVGDDLYVRSVNGRTSTWFRGVQTRYEGQIRAGGVVKDVTFMEEPTPRSMNRSTTPTAPSTAATRQALSTQL